MDAYEQELERFLTGSLRPSEVRAAGVAAGVDPSRWSDVQASAASPAADTWKRREAVRLFLSSRYGRDISDLEHDGYRAAWFGDGKDDAEAYAQVSAFFPSVPAGRLIAADRPPEPKPSGIMARIDEAIAPKAEELQGFFELAHSLAEPPQTDTAVKRTVNAAERSLTISAGGLVSAGLSLAGLRQTAKAVADMAAFRASFYEPDAATQKRLQAMSGQPLVQVMSGDWWQTAGGDALANMGLFTLSGMAGFGVAGRVLANPLLKAAAVGAMQGIGESGIEAGTVYVEAATRRHWLREQIGILEQHLNALSPAERAAALQAASGAALREYQDQLSALADPDKAAQYANQVLRRNLVLNTVLGALQMGTGAASVKRLLAGRVGAVLGALGLVGVEQAMEQEQEQYQEGWTREALAAWTAGRAAELDLMPGKTLRAFLEDDPEGKDIAMATLLQSGRSAVVNAAAQWGELTTLAQADERRRQMLSALRRESKAGNAHAAALLAKLDTPEARAPGAGGLTAFGERLVGAARTVVSRTHDAMAAASPEQAAGIDPDALLDDAGRAEADDIVAQIEEDREALATAAAEDAEEAMPEVAQAAAPAEPAVAPAAARGRGDGPAPAVAAPEAVRRGLAVAERLAAASPAAGRVEVIADADVPADVRAAQKSQGKRIAGYRRGDGTMVVVADNLDPDRVVGEVIRVWAHEQAHGGLRALFNGDTARVDAFLDWLQGQITPEALVGLLPDTGMSPEEAGRSPDRALRIASDEYMARLAEKVAADPSSLNQTQQTLWRRVLAMVRDGLRSLAGVDVRLSEAELQDIAVTLLRAAGVERLPARPAATRRAADLPPVVAFLQEQGGLTPKSRVKNPGGEYEGQPTAAELAPFAGAVFARSGGLSPDQAAQMMADRGMIADAYPETLWAALRGAVKDARAGRAVEAEAVKDGKATERFDAELRQPGAKGMAVEVDSLRMGDVLTSRGERLTVSDIDADTGAVRLSGAQRYGEQTVEAGATLYPETIERAADDGGADEDLRFSLTDEDRDYMAAVERGDMETAQRMVDEAAKRAGYLPMYHGTTRKGRAGIMKTGRLRSAGEPAVYLSTDSDLEGYGDGTVMRLAVKENRVEIDDEFPSGRQDYRVDVGMPRGSVQVKSADPVTRDDAGNIIPLSERFNDASPDIRFSLVDIDLGPRERVLAAAVAGDMLRGRSVGEKAVARRLREIGERTDAAGAVLSAARTAAAELRAQRLEAAGDTEILAALAGRVLRDRYRGNIAKTAEVGADQQAELEKSYRRIEGWRREYVRRMAEKRSGLSDADLEAAGQRNLQTRLAKAVADFAPKKAPKPEPGAAAPEAAEDGGTARPRQGRDAEDFDAAREEEPAAEAAALAPVPAELPTDPVDVAALKAAIVAEASAKLAREGYVVRSPNTDPVLRREVAATWARLLRGAAWEHLRPGARREWIREACRELELQPGTLRVIDRRVSQLAYWVSREAERTTAEVFVRQLEKLLNLKAVKGRTSQREELIRRKIEPLAKGWLRVVRDVYAVSEARREEMLEALKSAAADFDNADIDEAGLRERLTGIAPSVGTESVWQAMPAAEVLDTVHRAVSAYAAIASRPPGEIADAVERLRADYETGLARIEQARERRRKRLAPTREALCAGMRRLPEVSDHTGRKWLNDFVRGGFSFYNGMRDLIRYAKGEEHARGEAGIKAMALEIQAAHDDFTRRIAGSRVALEGAVRRIYGTQDVEGTLRRLEEPQEAFRRFSRNKERRHALSRANLLFIVAALEQQQYAANAEKYDRGGEYLREVRAALTPQDLALLDWLRGWYRDNRSELSAKSMEVLGVPVLDPDPLYHPVRVDRPGSGLAEMHYSLQLAPETFEQRRRHGWDIDETASPVGLYHVYAEANARFLSHVGLAQDLRYVYGHPETRAVLEEFAGRGPAKQVVRHVTEIAGGRGMGQDEAGAELMARARAATLLAQMSGNVGSGLRQLSAIPAFALTSGPLDVAKAMAWNLAHPEAWAAAVHEMREDAAFREWASHGYSEPVDNAMRQRGARLPGRVGRQAERLTRLIRLGMRVQSAGTQGAVFAVAPALYVARRQAAEAAGFTPEAARRQAMTETLWTINQTQGSSQVAMLSPQWRGSNQVTRMLMQFTGPTAQLYEWEALAIREAWAGTPGSRKRLRNVVVVNHVLIPAMYMAMKALWEGIRGDWRDDPEDEREETARELLAMMLAGPVGGVVLFGSLAEATVDIMAGRWNRGQGVPAVELATRFFGGVWRLGEHLTTDFDLEEALRDWDRVMSTVSAPWRDASKAIRQWGDE